MPDDENIALGDLCDLLETACEQLTVDVARLKQNARIVAKERTQEVARLRGKIAWLQAEIADLLNE